VVRYSFILALLAAPSLAAPVSDEDEERPAAGEARKRFAEGFERYNRGDYQAAAQSFLAAIAADPSLPGPYRNLGLTYRALDRCADAIPMYEKYLTLRPESRHTARVRREIDFCRDKLGRTPGPERAAAGPRAAAQGVLHVAANLVGGAARDGAAVRVDGLLRGATPLTVPVSAGVHQVHLERPGFASADATVEIDAGERRDVALTLTRLDESPRKHAEPPSRKAGR
jgi:tetratricopeptide (TPR) repeat protein